MVEKPEYPKRFYKSVDIVEQEGGYAIALDGRIAKTPAKNTLVTEYKSLAEKMREEWDAHVEEINPYAMPVARRRMIVIDQGNEMRGEWEKIILDYAHSDLVCYRADSPEVLVTRQKLVWDEYISWGSEKLGVSIYSTAGIMAVEQDKGLRPALESYLKGKSADQISAIAGITEMLGSAILALACAEEFKPFEAIFDASRVDEDFQIEKWGYDEEAAENTSRLKQDFLSAAEYLKLVR